jgi:hypothetical protein
MTAPWKKHLLTFLAAVCVGLGAGTTVIITFTPPIILSLAHKAISAGVGNDPVPDNTVYTIPFIASPETANGNAWLLGGNQDGLYTVGWLDLSKGPELLTIPAMGNRYHNVELVAPRTGVAFANLKAEGKTLLTAADDTTQAPSGVSTLRAPGKQVLVIGRTLVFSDADLPVALALARQIAVEPFTPSAQR